MGNILIFPLYSLLCSPDPAGHPKSYHLIRGSELNKILVTSPKAKDLALALTFWDLGLVLAWTRDFGLGLGLVNLFFKVLILSDHYLLKAQTVSDVFSYKEA